MTAEHTREPCSNCGADYGLHHYKTEQCPAGGYEAPVGKKQQWEPHSKYHVADPLTAAAPDPGYTAKESLAVNRSNTINPFHY
jgi:hypothetical protein